MKTAFILALLLLTSPALAQEAVPTGFDGDMKYAPGNERDAVRFADMLALAGHIEAYRKKTGHYPLLAEPQPEMLNVPITNYRAQSAPEVYDWRKLELEISKALATDIKIPRDPTEGKAGTELRIYQYATDGQDYYISANFEEPSFYTRRLDPTHHLLEVTSRPNKRDYQFSLWQQRHYGKHGPDTTPKQIALATAIAAKDEAAAKAAIEDGANLSPPCEFRTRCQPLADAAFEGDARKVAFLLENGADVNGYTAYYDVALTSALSAGKADIVRMLLDNGADVNLPNAFGVTPFIGALASGDIDMARLLLEKGGNVNRRFLVQNSDAQPGEMGERPLEAAIGSKKPAAVEMLLKAGADPKLTGLAGATMLQLAEGSGVPQITALIKAALK